MNLDLIQLLVGLGIIGAMWRLTREVASLSTSMSVYVARTEDHEERIRRLENL